MIAQRTGGCGSSRGGYQRARVHLRAGRSLVWNATNVSRQQRDLCVGLAANYHARVEIVALDAPPTVVRPRNRARRDPVPDRVLDRIKQFDAHGQRS